MSFNELGLKETLLKAVEESGYTTPTPIQQQAIPAILTGRDVMAAAQTGTGKTAGFTLPLLQRLSGKTPVAHNHVRALILTPTRELAAQIQESIETYGKHEKLRSIVVFGGVNINPQMMNLRKGCDILVATPGRLLDLYQQNAVKFNALEVLILDEADRMLDMGFIRDIRKILALLPKQRQNLMFSATFSDEIRALAKTICHQAIEIDVAPRNSTVATITQQMYDVSKEHKLPLLGKLLQDTREQVLVFSRTKHGANNLVKKLAQYGVSGAAIHGNKSQPQRMKALADFKSSKIQVLVATDIAARGIDIDQLAMVINYDLPQVPEDYVHRIGRTGRAGASGVAISLVTDEDNSQLRSIERLIKRKIDRLQYDSSALPVRTVSASEAADEADDSRESSRRNARGGRSDGSRARRPRGGDAPRAAQGETRRHAEPNGNRIEAASGERGGQRQQGRSNGGRPDGQRRQGQANPARARAAGPRQSSSANSRQGGQHPSAHARQDGQRSGENAGQRRSRGGNGRGRRPGGTQGERSGNSSTQSVNSAHNKGEGSFWQKLRDVIPGLG